jgi:Zn-dependent peptidase ImmA (M78 family)
VDGVPYGTIAINRNIRESGRQLFTIAHEIGHYLLPGQQRQSDICGKYEVSHWGPSLPRSELDANTFAAEILMPTEVMNQRFLKPEPSFDLVKAIAMQCGTTLTASGYRLVELSSFRVAIVWSSAEKAVWYKASGEFSRAIRRGALAKETYAFDAFTNGTIPDRLEPVPASAWLYESNLKPDAKVWEHSLPLRAYGGVLTLLYLKEAVQKRTDYSEADEPELDPEEFTLARQWWPKRG